MPSSKSPRCFEGAVELAGGGDGTHDAVTAGGAVPAALGAEDVEAVLHGRTGSGAATGSLENLNILGRWGSEAQCNVNRYCL